MTPYQYILLSLVLAISNYPHLLITDDVLNIYPWLIGFRNSPRIILVGIIVPLVFFIKNKRARIHMNSYFWGKWAPDYLHQQHNPNQSSHQFWSIDCAIGMCIWNFGHNHLIWILLQKTYLNKNSPKLDKKIPLKIQVIDRSGFRMNFCAFLSGSRVFSPSQSRSSIQWARWIFL